MRFAGQTFVAMTVLALSASATHAQRLPESEMIGELGISLAGNVMGFSLAVGPSVRVARITTTATVELVVEPPDADQADCEDPVTRQYEWSSDCAPTASAAGSVEVAAFLGRRFPLMLGGGYRAGFGEGRYAVVGLTTRSSALNTELHVRVRSGANFFQVHVGASIPGRLAGR